MSVFAGSVCLTNLAAYGCLTVLQREFQAHRTPPVIILLAAHVIAPLSAGGVWSGTFDIKTPHHTENAFGLFSA